MDKKLRQAVDQLQATLDSCKDDADKADGGNGAAGTRVRTAMMQIKQQAGDIRKLVLEVRDSR